MRCAIAATCQSLTDFRLLLPAGAYRFETGTESYRLRTSKTAARRKRLR